MSRPKPDPRVVIVGGGITGLAAAYHLTRARAPISVALVEASDRLGGVIRTESRDGFLIEAGADSFVKTKPDGVALCRALGLEPEIISTRAEARKVYVALDGKLVAMPAGMALGVPTRIAPLAWTKLLTVRGKAALLREPFIPARAGAADESIESFATRRLGVEAAQRIAIPLLSGIYAGDAAKLSIHATFPQLVEMERRHGSLLRGAMASRGEGVASLFSVVAGASGNGSPFLSLRGGMASLVDALAAALPAGVVRTGALVRHMRRGRDGDPAWVVEIDGAEPLLADAVLLAIPAPAAARLVPGEEAAAALSDLRHVSTATVFFAFERNAVSHPLDATGFVVPRGEARILAATWISSKWDGRAPPGAVSMRAFVGGAQDGQVVDAASDEALVALARSELSRLMGRLGEPLFTRVFRHPAANPQPEVGHAARIDRVRAALRALGSIHVAGAGYDGVGIPDCARQGREAAERIARDVAGAAR